MKCVPSPITSSLIPWNLKNKSNQLVDLVRDEAHDGGDDWDEDL